MEVDHPLYPRLPRKIASEHVQPVQPAVFGFGGARQCDPGVYPAIMFTDYAALMPGSFLSPLELREAPRRTVFRWEPPTVQQRDDKSREPTTSLLDNAPYRMDSADDLDSGNDDYVVNDIHATPHYRENEDDDEIEVSSILHVGDTDESMDDESAPLPRSSQDRYAQISFGGGGRSVGGHPASSVVYDSEEDVVMEPAAPSRSSKARGTHVSFVGGKRRKRKNLPERIDVAIPTDQERKEYLAILRHVFRENYGLDTDIDWYKYVPATKEEMEAYENEQNTGPSSVTCAYIGPGWKTCRWNNTIFEIALRDFIAECEMRGRSGDDTDYLLGLVVDKFDRGFQRWKKQQPKPGETPEATHARNVQEYDDSLEKARVQVNRRNKYSRRVTTIDRCQKQKTSPGRLKGRLRRAVAVYLDIGGDACMSSDDDCVDNLGRTVRRKRVQPWRPKEVNHAMAVTDSLRSIPGLYSGRGTLPATSVPGFNESRRDPPRGLPISFYDRDWYDHLTPYRKAVLGALPDDRYDWIFEAFRGITRSTR
ncbi:uncharacterized protein TRAVEDRAFT_29016 [Trametes versicolor FP-101664 SS1]|uniref:uncharacterized protein n=1 Tax=Trametes versicolor (strain FP-101664) TaxID=717944 RepID=UPI00046246B9|nr:uncharacterized protein TRAVEDRAFT_29016 [Trametes versicolor FP-101664 SS1]EIW58371.1 hypothetical protein TRAVEDRAFT_29016 [Trametes versicolor FP-101664 SS1]